jgi:hypothetical protein
MNIFYDSLMAYDTKESIIDINNTINEYLNDLPINDLDKLKKLKFQDPNL